MNRRETASKSPDARPLRLKRCILCGNGRFVATMRTRLPWVQQCTRCGLALANPQPSRAELAAIYDEDYYRTFGHDAVGAAGYHRMKEVRFSRLLEVAERHFPVGRLLDVGSALGELLVVGRRRGWRPQGVEPNGYAVGVANQALPGATFHGTIEDYVVRHSGFDLVTCLDVLEHVRRPDQHLRRIHDLLWPGGGLLVTTIDVSSFPACLLGHRWWHYHRDHLWYFSRTSLVALARDAGLEVVTCCRARKIFDMHYILEILARTPNSGLLRRASRAALAVLPRRVLTQIFSLPEGLLLIARRPVRSSP